MELSTFLAYVFCLIDDWMRDQTVRTRGPRPGLHDSEAPTMEAVGAFLGIDTDKGIFLHFRRPRHRQLPHAHLSVRPRKSMSSSSRTLRVWL